MDLHLQFGYGMMDHSRTLVQEWSGGTVILSPRDLNNNQLQNLADQIRNLGGSVMLDPQFYLPSADHHRLISHSFWPDNYDSGSFWVNTELETLLEELFDLNNKLGCEYYILPGLFASQIDDDWLSRHRLIFQEAENLALNPEKKLATVALSASVVQSIDAIHRILDDSVDWNIGGVYLVCEHPNGDYLVEDPMWLANLLDLAAGFRLRKKKVVIGYSNQQTLIAGCVSTTAIASGTWLNVRSFPPDKFRTQYEEEIKTRTKWYYCPQSLSEYKIPFLDIALVNGVLQQMRTPGNISSSYSELLFVGPQPTTVQAFTEQFAFRHFLHCLRHQTRSIRYSTFDATIDAYRLLLDNAETLLRQLRSVGVTGAHRDFSNIIDVNRSALAVVTQQRGAMLRHSWQDIQ